MADLVSYVPNRVINGHCDCMFLYNLYQTQSITEALKQVLREVRDELVPQLTIEGT